MDKEQLNRIEELRWEQERRAKQMMLDQKLTEALPADLYSFISFSDSDIFQSAIDDWPDRKWEDGLYLQTELDNPNPINQVLAKFASLNSETFCYVYFHNYDFGIVRIEKTALYKHWSELIEIDGDQIFCYLSDRSGFICLEKTEDIMVGKESLGRNWLYEITYSNHTIKSELTGT
jgi:hypothetical protein